MCRPARRYASAALYLIVLLAAEFLLGDTQAQAAVNTPSAKTTPHRAKKAEDFGIPQVALINAQIRHGWEAGGLAPSGPATDNEWCRRLFLDLLGRIPTVTELNAFLADRTPNKKLKLVDRLLGDEYIEEYARNWTTLWSNVLVGRSGGSSDEDRRTNRQGLQQSLRRAMQRNTTYDRFVYDLISAQGKSRPGSEGFNGYVNFLANKLDDDGVQATAKTSQIFLGVQVQCTQCHNHPFNEWKQNQFWEMNAFFRQTKSLRKYVGGRQLDYVELTNQDFAGENNNPEDAAVFYDQRNSYRVAAYPVFIDGTKLKTQSGYLDSIDRRTELAKLVTRAPELSRAVVNRYWAHFLGYGFTKPIDDMGPHNPPTHPELLDGLAKELRTRSYDLKQLVRWITLSEAYGLSSKYGPKNKRDDPAMGEKPVFSRFYLRQMRAEELYDSLLVSTEAHKTRGSYEEQETLKQEWLSQFVIAFGTDENDETTTFNGTIPQTLMMMNGELVDQATKIEKGSFLERIASDPKLSNTERIQYLFMAALARKATSNETAGANQLLAHRGGNVPAALQDIWWALLNSNEFILNH